MKQIVILSIILILGLCTKAQDEAKKPQIVIDSLELIQVEPFEYIGLDMKGSYSQISGAYTKLWEESVKQFLDWDHGFFTVYHNSPQEVKEEELEWTVGTKLNSEDEITEPLAKKQWKHKQAVKVYYKGPLGEDVGQAYGKLHEWIAKNNYQVAGPAREKSLGRPTKDENGNMIAQMIIWMPVTKN